MSRSDQTHVAMCSGGMESTVATHVSVRWGPCDRIIYLDTKTGTEPNRRFVERLADELGVQLWTLRTHESYADAVRGNDFPGPSRHSIFYRKLKERQIQKLASTVGGQLVCWTGVRLLESDNRMRAVEPEQEGPGGRWLWKAPIYDWTREEIRRYVQRFKLPRNYLWRSLGRSGDCFCGCFASPEELIDAEAAGCERLVEKLRDLETEIDADNERGRWGWGGMSAVEQRTEGAEQTEGQLTLCSTCGVNLPTADGGERQ